MTPYNTRPETAQNARPATIAKLLDVFKPCARFPESGEFYINLTTALVDIELGRTPDLFKPFSNPGEEYAEDCWIYHITWEERLNAWTYSADDNSEIRILDVHRLCWRPMTEREKKIYHRMPF